MKNTIKTPISDLKDQIIARFENTNPKFLELAAKMIDESIIKRGIRWDYSNGNIRSPHILDGSIYIQELFLCFQWIICYYGLVIYDEAVVKHYENEQQGANNIINKELVNICEEFLEYAISLVYGYSEWDTKKYPSPMNDITGNDYHLKANQLFLNAINYIMCHEFAHAELKHAECRGKKDPQEIENEADKRAYDLMLDGCDGDNEMSIKMGILMALCSLLMLTPKPVKGGSHPMAHHRIKIYLEYIKPDEKSQLWSVACLFLGVWDMRYSKFNDFPDNVDTHKEMFYKVIDEIDKSL